jgi:hypothetical protein
MQVSLLMIYPSFMWFSRNPRTDALHRAIDALLEISPPVALSEVLPLMARMRVAAKDMKYLWVNSLLQRGGREENIKKLLELEDRVRTRISKGELTLKSRVARDRI